MSRQIKLGEIYSFDADFSIISVLSPRNGFNDCEHCCLHGYLCASKSSYLRCVDYMRVDNNNIYFKKVTDE